MEPKEEMSRLTCLIAFRSRVTRIPVLLFWAILLLSPTVQGQNPGIDSLNVQRIQMEHSPDFNDRDTVYINLLNKLADKHRYYDPKGMFEWAQKAMNLSEAAKFDQGMGVALDYLAIYYSDRGNQEKAIETYNLALSKAEKSKDTSLILEVHNNIANEYTFIGDYSKALNEYLLSIELAQGSNNKRMLSVLYENVANLYASQKDYEQALGFFEKVKKLNEEIGVELFSAQTNCNIASVYAHLNRPDYAMFNINQSIKSFEKYKELDWLAYSYYIKGKIYLIQEKFQWALFWFKQAEILHTKVTDQRSELELMNGMAEAYFGMNQDSISEQYALRAYTMANTLKYKEEIAKCVDVLYKLSKKKQDFATALAYHETYQDLVDTLTKIENNQSLTLLKTKQDYDKQKLELIAKNDQALAKQRNYVNVALAILLIFIIVTVLVHRNEKVQKKLNVELQANKEDLEKKSQELEEINATKDKLFSIIGHDLRGPIGAFQGLLKLFNEKEIGQREFMEYIPKLGADVDHISFTLNNLLTWGRTQMNGTTTKPTAVAMDIVVNDNINLLSEIAMAKSIKIVSHLGPQTLVWSDENQVDIVIRNLISNALKFTPRDGMITIMAKENTTDWEISVRDTGIGMDQETQNSIFGGKTYNKTTYGTENEKGTGLGLSLCKEMVELNRGTIWVTSIPRKGSSFYFTLPKGNKAYQKTG